MIVDFFIEKGNGLPRRLAPRNDILGAHCHRVLSVLQKLSSCVIARRGEKRQPLITEYVILKDEFCCLKQAATWQSVLFSLELRV